MVAPAPEAAPLAPVVFFDGECPLCNRSVAFLARHDRAAKLRFAHIQGRFAQANLDPALRDVGVDGTVLLLEPGGRISQRSAAVLRALGHASPRWRWLDRLAGSPAIVRVLDVLYAFVARNRDRWFGRHATCPLPDPSFRARFLD